MCGSVQRHVTSCVFHLCSGALRCVTLIRLPAAAVVAAGVQVVGRVPAAASSRSTDEHVCWHSIIRQQQQQLFSAAVPAAAASRVTTCSILDGLLWPAQQLDPCLLLLAVLYPGGDVA